MSLINDQLKRASQSLQQEDDTVRINLRPSSTAAFNPQSIRDSSPALKPQPTWDSAPASKPQPAWDSAPASKPQPIRDPAPASKPEPTWGWPPLPKKPGRGLALLVLVILLIAAAAAFIGIRHFSRNFPAFTTKFHVPQRVQATPPPKPAPVPATEKTVAVTAPAPRPMPLPPLKIQGITYYNAKWQAIINGKTVYVGNMVKGFRVAAISRNSVLFIAPDGSQKKLALGE